MLEKATNEGVLGTLFCLGVAIALLKTLLGRGRIKVRKILARAGLTGVFCTGAAAIYIWYPDAPAAGVLALGGFVGALGVEAVERILAFRWKSSE